MKLLVFMVFVAVAIWNIASTDGACYTQVSSSARVTRIRYVTEKYYYRTFIFGWIRKSAYRAKRVTYYVLTTVYSNKKIPCPVDGGWSDWVEGTCSATCGRGLTLCTRKCNNPEPANGGKDCEGISLYWKYCNEGCCPVDGAWSEWIHLGNCTRECGGGAQEQYRSCDSPKPKCGGRNCTGPQTQVIGCNPHCCPVNGGWSGWVDASDAKCSRSCGTGFKKQIRNCTNPIPQCGGEECKGEDNRTITCNEQCCPVDGGWSEWEDISECSSSCGTAFREQNRACNKPPTACGGLPCIGNDHRIALCNTTCCPVDGGWSEWKDELECSATCGGGVITQSRTCTNPSPSCGGSDCQGDDIANVSCNTNCCPADGGWSDWNVGDCSVKCGGGVKEKFRTCSNPKPTCGGKECSGLKVETSECNEFSCDGGDVYASGIDEYSSGVDEYSSGDWGDYSECSVTCGNGTRFRTRICIGDCKNETVQYEYESCDMGCCPVDGGWSEWKYDKPCSVTCGKGIETFSRTCTSPEPVCGGKKCDGPDTLSKDCDTQKPCPTERS